MVDISATLDVSRVPAHNSRALRTQNRQDLLGSAYINVCFQNRPAFMRLVKLINHINNGGTTNNVTAENRMFSRKTLRYCHKAAILELFTAMSTVQTITKNKLISK